MLKRTLLFCCDLAVIGGATLFAALLRDDFVFSREAILALLPYLVISLLVGGALLVTFGFHRRIWRLSALRDYLRIGIMSFSLVVLTVAFCFLGNRLQNIPRALPVLQGFTVMVGLVGMRVAARLLFGFLDARTDGVAARCDFAVGARTVILVGSTRFTALYIRSVEELAPSDVRIAGIVTALAVGPGQPFGTYPILGRLKEISRAVSDLTAQGVYVTHLSVMLPRAELGREELETLAAAAQRHSLEIEFFPEKIAGASSETLGARQGLKPDRDGHRQTVRAEGQHVARADALGAHRSFWKMKRAIDILASIVLICLLAPIFLIVGLTVALDVGVPVIFWQERPGAKGRTFRVYKFRTMRAGLDARGRRRPDEDRLSRIGRALRRFRLDELPQLFNVLVGEMSFVGPRPLLPSDQYPGLEARLAIAPGITGWAQVNGGREISAADKAALDVWYLQNACLRVDIEIVFATWRTVIKGEVKNADAINQAWRSLGARKPIEDRAQRGKIRAPAEAAG